MSTIELRSKDEEIFPVDIVFAQYSPTIKTMLKNSNMYSHERCPILSLPSINGETLKKVLEWCIYLNDDILVPEEDISEQRKREIQEWNKRFFLIDAALIFSIIDAADYLDIKKLWKIGSVTVRKMEFIQLQSNDEEVYTVDIKVAQYSPTIKTELKNIGRPRGEKYRLLLLPTIDDETLKKVLEWCTYHTYRKKDATESEDCRIERTRNEIRIWNKKFFMVDAELIFSIIDAAEYLDITDLRDTGNKIVAEMQFIQLQSKDNEIFTVDIKVAQYSPNIITILENVYRKSGKKNPILFLPNINGETLDKILEWCTYHTYRKKDATESEDCRIERTRNEIWRWNKKFFMVHGTLLFSIIDAAEYLDITDLRDMGNNIVVEMNFIKILSNDGHTLIVDVRAAYYSTMIKTMMEDLEFEEDEVLPLPSCDGEVFKKVMEWCTYRAYRNSDEDDKDETTHGMCKWDRKFFLVDSTLLYGIVAAADYLNIKELLDLGCKVIAKIIRGKNMEDAKKSLDARKGIIKRRKFSAADKQVRAVANVADKFGNCCMNCS